MTCLRDSAYETIRMRDMTMVQYRKFLAEFLVDESGISSVEYALLLSFVAGGIILGADALSTAIEGEMFDVAACISASNAAAANC